MLSSLGRGGCCGQAGAEEGSWSRGRCCGEAGGTRGLSLVHMEMDGAWEQELRGQKEGPPWRRGPARAHGPLRGRSSVSRGAGGGRGGRGGISSGWISAEAGFCGFCPDLDTRPPKNTPSPRTHQGFALAKIIYSTTLPSSGVEWESSMCRVPLPSDPFNLCTMEGGALREGASSLQHPPHSNMSIYFGGQNQQTEDPALGGVERTGEETKHISSNCLSSVASLYPPS